MHTVATLSAEECWTAALARDLRFDGQFVTAVHTTGIYCRPSCPSRTPKRENVSFFPTPEMAEEAGFRACRRCCPDERAFELEVVENLCRYIDDHADQAPSLSELSHEAHLSTSHLHRVFKRILGITPRQYIDARRLEEFTAQLKKGKSVTEALYDAGYGSSSSVYTHVPTQIGMTPAEYQRGGQGVQIVYTIVDSPLGRLLVAATTRGVCAVSLANSDRDLEIRLNTEYPAAEIQPAPDGLSQYVQEILRYLEGRQPHLDLPVDIQVTAFQRKVLDTLRTIPYGETRSYSDIAEAIGKPSAVRAVANACGANPVPLIIPCHRVIAKDHSLGGYGLGVERKKALLDMEKSGA